MKHRVFRHILPWLLVLLCLCVAVSCGDTTEGTDTATNGETSSSEESSAPDESASLPSGEPQDTVTATTAETDPATEAPETETETEGQSISFAVVSDVHLASPTCLSTRPTSLPQHWTPSTASWVRPTRWSWRET